MKYLIVIALGVVVFVAWPQIKERLAPVLSGRPREVLEMERLMADFPVSSTKGCNYTDVVYNVHKTDSLVNPLIGTVEFEDPNGMKFGYVFQRENDAWRFHALINTENGLDFTYLPGGVEMMMEPNMRSFLAKHGHLLADPTPAPTPAPLAGPISDPTPFPRSMPTPRSTPAAAGVQAEILRKYSTK